MVASVYNPDIERLYPEVLLIVVRKNCLLELIESLHLQLQLDGNRNQSIKRPFALPDSLGSETSNRCHLYFCSQPQSACELHFASLVGNLLKVMRKHPLVTHSIFRGDKDRRISGLESTRKIIKKALARDH